MRDCACRRLNVDWLRAEEVNVACSRDQGMINT